METVPSDVLLLSALFTVHPQPAACPLMQNVLMSSQALGLAAGCWETFLLRIWGDFLCEFEVGFSRSLVWPRPPGDLVTLHRTRGQGSSAKWLRNFRELGLVEKRE